LKIIFSERCLGYRYPGHVESPERVKEASEALRRRGYAFIEPQRAVKTDLLRVHTREWVETVESGWFSDADTPGGHNIYEYATLAAGGAMLAAETRGFSLLRPPGHHAGVRGRALGAPTLGFCYFNNMAVAVRHLDRPTLILDIDGHHGNGTQEIFLGDPTVTFVSLHRSAIYPGTGYASERNCLNFPLPPGAGDRQYLAAVKEALGRVDMNGVEVIGISAGFDAHRGDLASLGLTPAVFREVGGMIRACGREVFGVLEGGYVGENIATDLDHLIQGLEGKAR